MHLSELPDRPIVVDLETIAKLVGPDGTNATISLFVELSQDFEVITSAEVRAGFGDFSGQPWTGRGLDRVSVKSLNRALNLTMAGMIDACKANGIDPYSPVVRPKLALVGLAKMHNAVVVSVDARDTTMSMREICECLNVQFLGADDLEP